MDAKRLVAMTRTSTIITFACTVLTLVFWWATAGFPVYGAPLQSSPYGLDPGLFLFLAQIAGAAFFVSCTFFVFGFMSAAIHGRRQRKLHGQTESLRVRRLRRIERELVYLQNQSDLLRQRIDAMIQYRGRRSDEASLSQLLHMHARAVRRIAKLKEGLAADFSHVDVPDTASVAEPSPQRILH